jgi:hypothetical protein
VRARAPCDVLQEINTRVVLLQKTLKDEGATLQEEISSAIKGLQRLGEHRNSYSLIVRIDQPRGLWPDCTLLPAGMGFIWKACGHRSARCLEESSTGRRYA